MKKRYWLTTKIRLSIITLLLVSILVILVSDNLAEECTSAVVSGRATVDGRPLLWKNRDTATKDNKIVLFNEGPLKAIGLVNADSPNSVWMGMNEAGLAIINTDSDDLEGSSSSQNGVFQKIALLNCRSVAEFESLLQQTNSAGRLTRANYGVIDAFAAAAYFEVGNHTYARFDVADLMVRTNFAFTGNGTGSGHFRYNRALQILREAATSGLISAEFLLRRAARDLVNDVVDPYPLPYSGGQDGLPAGFIRTANSINRYLTRSAVVFQGVLPGEDPRLTTMWVMLGEPVCTIALPVWLLSNNVPAEMDGLATSLLCDAALLKKNLVYPLPSSPEYLNTRVLDDGHGGGIFSYTWKIEDWVFSRAKARLESWRQMPPPEAEVSQFQAEVANLAYGCFLTGSVPSENLPAPRNLSCQQVLNRSLLLAEQVHFLRWDPPLGPAPEKYRLYEVSSGERRFLGETRADRLRYTVRNIQPKPLYIYAVLAVDGQGREGNPAWVKIFSLSLFGHQETVYLEN